MRSPALSHPALKRAIAPIAALALVTTGVVVPGASLVPDAPAAAKKKSKPLKISKVKHPKTFKAKKKISFSVTLNKKSKHTVKLQYKSGSKWKKISTKRTSKKGKVTLRTGKMPSTIKSRKFRIEVPAAKKKYRYKTYTVKRAGFHVFATTSRANVKTGAKFTVTGSLTNAPAKRKIYFQRYSSGKWRTYTSRTTKKKNGSASIKVAAVGGTNSWRARSTYKGKTKYSPSVKTYGVSYKCVASGRPSQQFTFTQTDPLAHSGKDSKGKWIPKSTNGDGIMVPATKDICAAAHGSTIRVSNFIMRLSAKPSANFFKALEYKARLDGVHVKVTAETARGDSKGSFFSKSDIKKLRTFATVTPCYKGCSDYRSTNLKTPAASATINHSKLVTISNMNWKKGSDPYVWYSSANYSDKQLLKNWQNAVTMRDANSGGVYSATVKAYDQMAACSKGKTQCAKVKGLVRGHAAAGGWANIWGIKTGLALPSASAQSGRTVTADFTPKVRGYSKDPWVTLFNGMSCGSTANGNGVIDIANYRWTKERVEALEAPIIKLGQKGCKVRMLVDDSNLDAQQVAKPLDEITDKINDCTKTRDCKRAYMEVRYTNLMHVKQVQARGVTFNGKPNRYVWYGGSQNLTNNSRYYNSENMMLLTDSNSGGSLSAFRNASNAHFAKMWDVDENTTHYEKPEKVTVDAETKKIIEKGSED